MLTVTFGDLKNPLFLDAIKRLYSCMNYGSVTESYSVGQICKQVNGKLRDAQEELDKLTDRYAEKDAEGKIVFVEGHRGMFKVPDALSAEYEKALAEFDIIEFTVDAQGLTGKILDAVKLSPAHLDAIECLKHQVPPRIVGGSGKRHPVAEL